MNKYTLWYNSIIENARTRTLDCYKESHHILPRSLGGTDEKHNLVDLTAREHFICHWLLVKIHTGQAQHKMIYALNGMKRNGKDNERYETAITSRVYARLRAEFGRVHSETMKGRKAHNKGKPMGDEQKKKLSIQMTGRKVAPEVVARRAATQTGQKRSQETKDKIKNALKGKSKGPMSEENKLKISMGAKGVKKTASHANNVRNAMLGNISINKDNVEKKVKNEELQSWLEQGWQLGGRKRKQA
jgi:hypothetical protein